MALGWWLVLGVWCLLIGGWWSLVVGVWCWWGAGCGWVVLGGSKLMADGWWLEDGGWLLGLLVVSDLLVVGGWWFVVDCLVAWLRCG